MAFTSFARALYRPCLILTAAESVGLELKISSTSFCVGKIMIRFGMSWWGFFPVSIYLFRVNNGNTRTIWEICSKLTLKTERCYWLRSGIFIVNLTDFTYCSGIAIVDFEQVNAGWEETRPTQESVDIPNLIILLSS